MTEDIWDVAAGRNQFTRSAHI